MTIQYKSASKILDGTAMTTLLTISTSAIAIVKSVYISNNSTGAVLVNCDLRDSDALSDIEFFRKDIPATSTVNATEQGLNLEAGDAIKAQAETANKLEVVVSYALINRENENG
jgi:hypothetical protein|tara:strand:+ start:391 stop:732 length:342 start_codon:yes stop_codon:yes gene_type:complete